MSIHNLTDAAPALSDRPTRTSRHWLEPLTAAVDCVLVAALVHLGGCLHYLATNDAFGMDDTTTELAGMLTALFLFVNLMRNRYQIGNYLSGKGQMAAAFSAWNITIVAFLVLLFLARIVDNYSRAVILATYLAGIPVIGLSRAAIVRLIAAGSRTGRIAAERIFLIGREDEVMSFAERYKPWHLGTAIVDVAFLKTQPDQAGARAALAADLAAAA